jgi:hypothetical protein
MAKTHPLGFRLEPEVKEALEKAAKDDMRSVSSYVEKLLIEHLREKGYLKTE